MSPTFLCSVRRNDRWPDTPIPEPIPMKTRYKGYHISRGYVSLTIYNFEPDGSRMSTIHFRPNKGKTRRERYDLLADRLRREDITPPLFQP